MDEDLELHPINSCHDFSKAYLIMPNCKAVKYELQVGGHHTMLQPLDRPHLILKPVVQRELLFYETLTVLKHPLLEFMPKFYGSDDSDRIVIENLTYGMEEPRILDIKIGRRLYDIDATSIKIRKRIRKSNTTASGIHGFRFCGYFLDGVIKNKADLFHILQKEQIFGLLEKFLESETDKINLLDFYLYETSRILQAVETSNVQLISSSLLFVYDNANPKNRSCTMIDFAHSHLHPAEINHYDDNYLEGLQSLRLFIQEVRERHLYIHR